MMPNILGAVGEGMFAIAENEKLGAETDLIKGLFSKIGKVIVLPEQYLAAVTAVSGSAPAYVFMFIEALANGGIREGLPCAVSYEIASQVVLGSAKLALESDAHPAALREKVCSPAGTTIEAVASLENDGFKAAVMNAVAKCANKS
jgi:pyrroline-5-carboxylate reductase